MKIAILFTGYNCSSYIKDFIHPWIDAKKLKTGGHEFIISVVSVPFEEYKDITEEEDSTVAILKEYLDKGSIDYLVDAPKFVKEHIARDNALQPLLKEKVDAVWLADADELITLEQIGSIANYIVFNSFVQWFSLSYKNYVFDSNTYLVEPFTPPRIFMNGRNGHMIKSFFWDNDIAYGSGISNQSYKSFINITIPKEVAWIKHYSWISNAISQKKVLYQEKHFVNGIGCSYKWDAEKGLMWNEKYFEAIGKPIPTVAHEISTQESS